MAEPTPLSEHFGDVSAPGSMLRIYRSWKLEHSGDLQDFSDWCRRFAGVIPSEVMSVEDYDELLREGIQGSEAFREFIAEGLDGGP